MGRGSSDELLYGNHVAHGQAPRLPELVAGESTDAVALDAAIKSGRSFTLTGGHGAGCHTRLMGALERTSQSDPVIICPKILTRIWSEDLPEAEVYGREWAARHAEEIPVSGRTLVIDTPRGVKQTAALVEIARRARQVITLPERSRQSNWEEQLPRSAEIYLTAQGTLTTLFDN